MKWTHIRWQVLTTVSVVVVLIVCSVSVFANDIKIGIVNTDKILRESLPAINAQIRIEQEFLPRDIQTQEMVTQAKELQQQLENDRPTVTEKGRRDMERKLASLSREFQRAQEQMREDLTVRKNDEYGLILENTNLAIKHIAEMEQYDLILQLQDAVYHSERIDITDQVIQLLADQWME